MKETARSLTMIIVKSFTWMNSFRHQDMLRATHLERSLSEKDLGAALEKIELNMSQKYVFVSKKTSSILVCIR